MILLDNIHQTYRGPKGPVHALRGVSLHIRAGEVFGVIGRSGAGKSSLVRTINLLNRPSQGTVTVAGRSLTTLNAAGLRAARRDIGMIFQHFNLLTSRTVFDNVALPLIISGVPRVEIGKRVRTVLEKVGLGARERALPIALSSGEQQRVGIARAVAAQPLVLVADEPTGNLDPNLAAEIMQLFASLPAQGTAVIVASHDLHLVRRLQKRVLVLDHGKLIDDFRPEPTP